MNGVRTFSSKLWSPAMRKSSTCTQTMPDSSPFSTQVKTLGSTDTEHPSEQSFFLTIKYQLRAASSSPYTVFFSLQKPLSFASFGGIKITSRLIFPFCKNTARMSIHSKDHFFMAIMLRTVLIDGFATVGDSEGSKKFSSKPLTTSRFFSLCLTCFRLSMGCPKCNFLTKSILTLLSTVPQRWGFYCTLGHTSATMYKILIKKMNTLDLKAPPHILL